MGFYQEVLCVIKGSQYKIGQLRVNTGYKHTHKHTHTHTHTQTHTHTHSLTYALTYFERILLLYFFFDTYRKNISRYGKKIANCAGFNFAF